MHRKCLIVMSIEFLGFLVEAVQFYEFHEAKHNKRSLKRDHDIQYRKFIKLLEKPV